MAQERVRVTIVDDDDAGVIGFELPDYEVGTYSHAPIHGMVPRGFVRWILADTDGWTWVYGRGLGQRH